MTHVLLLILFGTGYWQLAPRQGDRMHMVYRSAHDKVVGEISQRRKDQPFTARCTGGIVTFVQTEGDAKRLVEACPER